MSVIDLQAREAMLIQLYRQDKLSRYELAQALGLDRFQIDGLLKRHHVTEELPTNRELEEDFESLQKLLGR